MIEVNFQLTRNNFNTPLELPVKRSGEDVLVELEELSKKKEELLATQEKIQRLLSDIDKREKEIKEQIATKEMTVTMPPVEIPRKAAEIAHSVLVINTKQITHSIDNTGERKHYSVSLISKNNEIIESIKLPIDTLKYGELKQIIITDGENKTALDTDYLEIQRLIKYFSTNFETLRKEINTPDHNGYYGNKYTGFDCQRFSYYINHGKEGTYGYKLYTNNIPEFRNNEHFPNRFYSIKAQTAAYGSNGCYKNEDMSVHHYMCLTKDVFVSKFGSTDVLFTSYEQILDAYFPEKFTSGSFSKEYW